MISDFGLRIGGSNETRRLQGRDGSGVRPVTWSLVPRNCCLRTVAIGMRSMGHKDHQPTSRVCPIHRQERRQGPHGFRRVIELVSSRATRGEASGMSKPSIVRLELAGAKPSASRPWTAADDAELAELYPT